MKNRRRELVLFATLLLFVPCTVTKAQTLGNTPARLDWPIQEMPNLLNLHHEPESATDRSHEMFFDQGAWHGYALPPNNDTGTGFVGPFLGATAGGLWAGSRFATVALNNSVSKDPILLYACDSGGVSLPGALARQACGGGIVVTETLFYPSASTTLVRVTITSSHAKSVQLTVGGNQSGPVLSEVTLQVKLLGSDAQAIHGEDGRYSFTLPHKVQLAPSHPAIFYLQQSYFPDTSGAKLSPWKGSPENAWKEASKRWKLYLVKSRNLQPEFAGREDVRRINVKAIITLLGNWRVPLGDMQYAGLFPSYSNPDFNAFWSWDSWKHAAALATFAPDLAKDQVRAIFDFQEPNGMIPDKVSRNRAENNLRDTKPPLAAWAVAKIYEQTHDRQFVGEMFDRLYRYHRWWYTDRDHDHNGLAEYGSTDGTLEAARWESGMDNAVRFDGAAMLQNGQGAWSLDQESVDLNCYLYQDKLELADMAALLGKAALAKQLREEASTLRTRIQRVFFDPPSGYFFDKRLGQESLIRVFGPEGWIPLWTGVASEEQAKDVAKVLRDPAKFNTIFPFPTLAKDDPRFTAGTGYWRGPVWIDQAVFALQGMIRYGMARDADEMRTKLLTNSPGLAGVEPFRETYNPDTGEGQNSRNFGWSAAEYFLLIH